MMFYRGPGGGGGRGGGNGAGLSFGPVKLTFFTFYSSLISAAIIAPAVFILTTIFRKRKLKHAPFVTGK